MVLDNSVQQFNNNKMENTISNKVVDLKTIKDFFDNQINTHKELIEQNQTNLTRYRFDKNENMAQWSEGRIAGHMMAVGCFERLLETLENFSYEK